MKYKIASLHQSNRNAKRLHRAENDGDVASPLRNLLASQLAFFLQLSQRFIHHGQQLQNDRCRDVRHDAQSEERETAQIAAGKQIDEPQQRSRVLIEILFQLEKVHTRCGQVSAQPVNREHRQCKQNPLAQVRNAEDVRHLPPDWKYSTLSSHYCKTSTLPPALVIFSCADFENLCACTVIAIVNSPSPRIFTGNLALITPALRSTSGVIGAACSPPPSATSRSRLTMLNSLRKMLVKPRFGMRRCSGICPPSNPRISRIPVRERCPLFPRVDVLPMPDPIPRPTRLRFSDAFFGARILDKFINKSRFQSFTFQSFEVSKFRDSEST